MSDEYISPMDDISLPIEHRNELREMAGLPPLKAEKSPKPRRKPLNNKRKSNPNKEA
jgi:hypothetical protein